MFEFTNKPHGPVVGDVVKLDVPEQSMFYNVELYVESIQRHGFVYVSAGELRYRFLAPIEGLIIVRHSNLLSELLGMEKMIERSITGIPISTDNDDLIRLRKTLINTQDVIKHTIAKISKEELKHE